MKLIILKYWQLDNPALKLIIVFFISLISCKAQLIENPSAIEKHYHTIINKIVLKDTVISEARKRIWQNRIDTGKSTPEEIDNRISIHNEKCRTVFLQQSNANIIAIINKDLERGGPLTNYFGRQKLQKALLNQTHNITINESLLDSIIKINDGTGDSGFMFYGGHVFSAPVVLGDYIIIHHAKFTGKYSMWSRVLIYSISKEGKPILKKIFYRSMS